MAPDKWGLAIIMSLLIPIGGIAQGAKIAIVDFEKVVVGSAAGKKASDQWNAKYAEHQKTLEARQKEISDAQNKLQTQANILSETAKADLTRDIDRKTTDLNRLSEDAQKEMEDLRAQLLQPISENAQAVLQAYAAENDYSVVVDISNPDSNVVYSNPKAEITDAVIKRIDSQPAPAAATPAAAPK